MGITAPRPDAVASREERAEDVARREERIEIRATREEKRLLAAAAAHEHMDVTSFILRNALPAAKLVVDEAERYALSERDSARVLDLLENPPEPTPRLLKAASGFRENARGSVVEAKPPRKGRRRAGR